MDNYFENDEYASEFDIVENFSINNPRKILLFYLPCSIMWIVTLVIIILAVIYKDTIFYTGTIISNKYIKMEKYRNLSIFIILLFISTCSFFLIAINTANY